MFKSGGVPLWDRLVGTLGTWNIFAVRGMNLNMD